MVVAHHGERRAPRAGRDAVVSTPTGLSATIRARCHAGNAITVFGACAAGGLAMVAAVDAVRSSRADGVVVVGVDAMINDFDFFQFANHYAMSTRECDPTQASCPFDARRDGFVLAEGAAAIVVESSDHARRRTATALARVIGCGVSQNAFHMISSPPDALGPYRAIAAALADARCGTDGIDYVNAHGTSTRDNDWCETMALRRALGPDADATPVSSTKSVTGHLMAAAGVLEAGFAVLSIRDGVLPPTINLSEPDPNCDLDYVAAVARPADVRRALSNSFGFGGHNASLVVGRP